MFDAFLFQILPYIAAAVFVLGVTYRFLRGPIGVSSMSSQFLEGETLRWGSGAWHLGIIALLVGHIFPLLAPGYWSILLQIPGFLLVVESIGLALGFLAAVGLFVLIFRRLGYARIRAVTSPMDTLVLFLLLGQVVLGLSVALGMRWGAAWAPGVLAPYILSLATFQPDIATLANMGWVMHAHIIGAWLLLGLVPFSRLIHALSVPVTYPARRHQKVVWANPRSTRASRSL
jgi:nitrate reductase gamma subunit